MASSGGLGIGEPSWDPSRFPPSTGHSRLRVFAELGRDPIGYLCSLRDQLGPVFTLRLFPYEGLVCAADAATNREVLTDQDRFVGGRAASMLVPWIGRTSLIVATPPRHLPNRKLLLPPFHGEHVARWGDRMRELITAELDTLPEGEPVAIRPMAQRLALDVILRLVFGVTDEERMLRFREALGRLLDPRLTLLLFAPRLQRNYGRFSPGGQLERRRQVVVDLIREEIATRRSSGSEADDVLSILLRAEREDGSPGFGDDELLDELRGLVIAGHETTATALAWTLHLLAHETRAQDELRASLDAGESDYLRAALKEVSRIRPAVFDAVRSATRDTELGGHPVPEGAVVSALFTVTHRDPEIWPEPDRFLPERHLESRDVPYSLTPFGGGVRRCLGASLAQLELEVAVREILGRARLEPSGPLESTRLHSVTLVPAKGGRVILRPRPRPARKPRPGAAAIAG